MPAPKKFTSDDTYGASSRRQSAKEVRANASGKVKTPFPTKKERSVETGEIYSPEARTKARMLASLGRAVNKPQTKKESASESANYEREYTKGDEKGMSTSTSKKVTLDAYDTLGRLADNNNLKGKARDIAIKDALKVVEMRMQSDRNRTANRAESTEKRAAKKKAKSYNSKLIGG